MSNKLFEYLLVYELEENIRSHASELKKKFTQQTGFELACKLKPHITIANTIQLESNERKILESLKYVSSLFKPIHYNSNGIGCYSNTGKNVIYMNVEHDNKISKCITKNVRRQYKGVLAKSKIFKPIYTYTPHVTIARNVDDELFEKVWPKWQNIKYLEKSILSGIQLLKREVIDGYNKFEHLEVFSFSGDNSILNDQKISKNMNAIQLKLF